MANALRVYEVEMMFSASVGMKQINDILGQMGCHDALQIKDAVSISVKQVLPEIPDDVYLKKVADVIKDNYETNDINLTECHFVGYKNIREIKLPREQSCST